MGKPAQAYIQKRALSMDTVKRFGLGFSPDAWAALTDTMKEKGYRLDELIDAGLSIRGKNGGVYDRFRNRLMFPVIDVRGSVIGFSGRILGDGEPKYMNSPETMVFNKSRNLFALNLAKKSKSGHIILAEGNVDVVMMHQAGFDGAVASLGTSLTPEQARAVDAAALTRFLQSPLCARIRAAGERARREYRFSLLESAARFVPEASAGDEILLQGVVDCFFEEDGALVVVDFKTDRVAPDALAERAEHYRPQLEAYSLALAQVIGKPVKEKILYFLRRGEQITL